MPLGHPRPSKNHSGSWNSKSGQQGQVLDSRCHKKNNHYVLDIAFQLPGFIFILVTLDLSIGIITALSSGHIHKPSSHRQFLMTLDKKVLSSEISCWSSVCADVCMLLHLFSMSILEINLITMQHMPISVRIVWHVPESATSRSSWMISDSYGHAAGSLQHFEEFCQLRICGTVLDFCH